MHLFATCLLFATAVYCSQSSVTLDIVGRCDNSNCPRGERCVLNRVQCVQAPCPPVETCVSAIYRRKPGTCPAPRPDQIGICVVRCFGDDSCPGDQKCCGGCPKVCTDPVPVVPVVKPGSCPAPQPGQIGICVVRCFGDDSCPGDQKCCGSCPKVCKDPVGIRIEKPGSCPARRPGHIGICVAHCTDDESCSGNQKCCGSCPRSCTTPVGLIEDKPGRCPPRLLSFFGGWCKTISNECTVDSQCEGEDKCCNTGCGHRCSRPFPEMPIDQIY